MKQFSPPRRESFKPADTRTILTTWRREKYLGAGTFTRDGEERRRKRKCPRQNSLLGSRGSIPLVRTRTNDSRNAPPGGFKGKYWKRLLYPARLNFSREFGVLSSRLVRRFQDRIPWRVDFSLLLIFIPRASIFPFPSVYRLQQQINRSTEGDRQRIWIELVYRFWSVSSLFFGWKSLFFEFITNSSVKSGRGGICCCKVTKD